MEYKLTDQYLQEQFIGKTFTDKLNEDIGAYFIERKFSKLGFLPRPGVIGVCNILEDNEIMALGGSDPDDQINDNLGKVIASVCSVVSATDNDVRNKVGGNVDPPINTAGIAFNTAYMYGDYNNSALHGGSGRGVSAMQLGDDATPPTISDIVITSPLPLAPEGTRSNINGQGTYTGGPSVNFIRQFGPCSGSGVVREMGWFLNVQGGAETFLMSHDIINPVLPYVFGQFILAEYFITI